MEVEVRRLPAERVAFTQTQASYLNAGELLARVKSWAVTMGVLVDGPLSVVFLGEPSQLIDPANETPFEVWVPVGERAMTTADDPVQVKTVASVDAAVRAIRGAYDPLQLGTIYAETEGWLETNGYRREGAPRWRYLEDPGETTSTGRELEMELAFPVDKSSGPATPASSGGE